jgi:hypothetical protein
MELGKKVNSRADLDVDDGVVELGFLDPKARAELGWKTGAYGQS